MRLATAFAAIAAAFLSTAVDASRLTPPALPLIVRNPYLSTWLANARDEPWTNWPIFWAGQNQGMSVMASLPDEARVFPLLGRPHDSLDENDDGYNISYAKYNGATYGASVTNLSYTINSLQDSKAVDITLSFLSPMTPSSTFRQSIPASYLTVYVSGNLNVDVYVDLNGQWVSGDRGNLITWELQNTALRDSGPGLKTWKVKRDVEQLFTETADQAEWGTLYFSAPETASHESGVSEHLRKQFGKNSNLRNHVDTGPRGIMDAEPVFAFSKSFALDGPKTAEDAQSITFTIAHIQDPLIQFAAARGLTLMRPLWATYMPDVNELIAWHYDDFSVASQLANKYDSQLAKDAYVSGADDYVDIVALSARQVMGAAHFAGTPDNPLVFLKEISSDGNTNTIDVIFPAFPFFMYTNPRWLAYMLEPLLEHIMSGQYPNKYAMHDLGANYPNATGHPDGNDEYMPVEECGNILIMGLALANALRDGTNSSVSATSSSWEPMITPSYQSWNDDGFQKVFPLNVGSDEGVSYIDDTFVGTPANLKRAQAWVNRTYKLWTQWTAYLVEFSLEPANQLSTDDFAGWLELQTNLALKGIIGIKAMSGLAEMVGNKDDALKYDKIANEYITKWEEYGMSRDKTHAKLSYNWEGSWTTIYNLYADSLLCFHISPTSKESSTSVAWSVPGAHGIQKPLRGEEGPIGFVPQHIYQAQSDWYYSVRQNYGLPLDSRHLYTKTDWEFWALSVAAPKVRANILESVAKWVNETATNCPLTDLPDTEHDGNFGVNQFRARPVVGGHFAFLSLERACGGHAMDGLKFLNDDIVDRE